MTNTEPSPHSCPELLTGERAGDEVTCESCDAIGCDTCITYQESWLAYVCDECVAARSPPKIFRAKTIVTGQKPTRRGMIRASERK